MLQINSKAPDFTLQDEAGVSHSLSESRGQWVLLYFYPKDDTPGCTKEACSFRDNLPHFEKLKVKVIGVSADSGKSHGKFKEKYGLNFTILSDPNKEVIKLYDAGGVFTKRISYLIDPDGVIKKAYAKVDPNVHADEVLKDMKTV